MSSQAFAGLGTKFYRWSSSSQWEVISEITSISGPSLSREMIEVTSLDATDGYREFIGGFRDGGTVSLSMNFIAGNYTKLKADFESNELQNYKIVLSNSVNTKLEFEGLVMELPPSVDVGSAVSLDVTIQVTNKVELGTESSGS